MVMKSAPKISIIIVIWNAGEHFSSCLSALSRQTEKEFEIVVIDNGSTDGVVEDLSCGPEFHIAVKKMEKNLGFAVANNLGARLARGEWIVLLNADAYPEPDWLEQLLKTAKQNPDYNFFSSRQIQYNSPHLLDGAGDDYHVSGLAWRRYYNHTREEYGLKQEEVFGACAAAAMYRREDFLKVGGFDEDYFSYFEDVDLSFRLRLAGGKCLYVPQAVVHHVGSASTGKISDFVVYHGHRNLVWAYFKDMPSYLFWVYLPLHLVMNLYFMISFILKGKGQAILKAKWDALRGLPASLRKRRMIQKMRTVPVSEIYRWMSRGLLEPYWASRQRKQEGRR